MEQRVISKVMWRLVPFMILLYILNYIDRVNISVAKLQLLDDLKFDEKVFGFASGIFFPAYFLFEVPSNVMMEKFGARVWIARIMISWGIISASFVFLQGKWSFYALRFLLGAAEAGFFPGMLLYLTYWIPAKNRANVGALFMTSIAMAGVIGNPLSGYILHTMKNVAGLHGWQWLFLLEGVPTIVLGFVVYYYFTDKPEDAKWLEPAERDWLATRLEQDRAVTKSGNSSHNLVDAFKSGRVWLLSMIYMSLMMGFYAINYWTPTIVKNLLTQEYDTRVLKQIIGDSMSIGANGAAVSAAVGSVGISVNEGRVGNLSAIPFVAAVIGMVLIGKVADWTGNRKGTLIFSSSLGCLGLLAASQTDTTVTTLIAMSIAAVGIFGSLSPFWTLPSAFLTGTAAAAGIAFINSLGNLGGGFAGLNLKGYLMETYHTHKYGMMVDAGVLFFGVIMVMCIKTKPKSEMKTQL